MPLFLRHKICLIHIPKCGGTSFAHAMRSLGDPPLFYNENFLANQEHPAEHSPQHATYRQLSNMNMLPAGFKVVAVTRNPIERLLSEYRWRLKIREIDATTSQDTFAEMLFSPGSFWDNHQKSQMDFMRGGGTKIKTIDINKLTTYFLQTFGYRMAVDNSTGNQPNTVTSHAESLVRRHWSEDFT